MRIERWILVLVMMVFIGGHAVGQNQKQFEDSMMNYYTKGDFRKAIFWAEKNADAIREKVGEEDTLYADAIGNLGTFYFLNGSYETALPISIKSTALYKKLRGSNHPDYATCLNNLASLYCLMGKFTFAEPLYSESMEIDRVVFGEQSAQYAMAINNLGKFYIEIGKYSLAETMLSKASDTYKKALGENSSGYAFTLNNLAAVYSYLGNYAAAEPLLVQGVAITKKQLGEKHPDYLTALGNLAELYNYMAEYAKAKIVLEQVVSIKKEVLGEDNPFYALALDNLAYCLFQLNKTDPNVIKFFKQALEIRKRVLGTENSDYASSLYNLAQYYTEIKAFILADSLCKKALDIKKIVFGESHPETLDIIRFSSYISQLKGDYNKATEMALVSLEKENILLVEKLDYLSQTELLEYLKKSEAFYKQSYTSLSHDLPELVKTVYNSQLLLKGISIQNNNSLYQQMNGSNDSSILAFWKQYQANRILLNKTLAQPIIQRTINTDSLGAITNMQEKELLRKSAIYRDMKNKLNITWKDIRNNLKPGEAAIEFVPFRYIEKYNKNKKDIKLNYYSAILIRPQDTVPQFVKLFEEKQLIAAIKTFAYKAPVAMRGSNPNKVSAAPQTMNNTTYKLLWQPLLPYLANTKTIYFSPDGLLHQLAFAAIPINKDSLLCDRYNLVQVTSTRQVALHKNKPDSLSNIALFGGIDYNHQSIDTSVAANADPYAYVYQQNRGADVDSFKYLPSTLQEVAAIQKGVVQRQTKAILFNAANATEAAFRSISGNNSPSIIHFATHGFTIPDTTAQKTGDGNTFKISSNPLLRCGLVMAGGNKGWKGKSGLDEDDGILTGLEISSTNLQNTQLAVLSACETGLGKLEGSEGVFGLQRAFKLAGVNYVMASLWQVPDKETAEFMQIFYTNLFGGKTIRQSFLETQKPCAKNMRRIIGQRLH